MPAQLYRTRREGCDSISRLSIDSAMPLHLGGVQTSPGRMAAVSDLSLVLAARSNGIYRLQGNRALPVCGSIYALRLSDDGVWQTLCLRSIEDPNEQVHLGFRDVTGVGGIAISSDDQWLYVATQTDGTGPCDGEDSVPPRVRRGLSKFALNEINWAAERRGPEHAWLELGAPVAEILLSRSAPVGYAVTAPQLQEYGGTRPQLVTFDVDSLLEVRPRVELAPIRTRDEFMTPCGGGVYWPVAVTHADLSPDQRFVVTNRLDAGEINVVRLEDNRTWTLPTAGLTRTAGIAFNYREPYTDLLLVHGVNRVGVYRWREGSSLQPLALVDVDPPSFWRNRSLEPRDRGGQLARISGPLASVSWSTRGDRAIAAVGAAGPVELQSWHIRDQGTVLIPETAYEVCLFRAENALNDILSGNHLVPATPTPTASSTASVPVATSTLPAQPTSTTTPTPVRVYLPLGLNEHCSPNQRGVDVAIVLDTSSSMSQDVRAGYSKLKAAQEAASSFVENLNGSDRVAIVWFNETSAVEQVLTSDRRLVLEALRRLRTSQFTRIDLGVESAQAELLGTRRIDGHRQVMILLTDGKANPVPVDVAVRRAEEARAAGITIFTIGLGDSTGLDASALRDMASQPEYYFETPSASDLHGIYAEIAQSIPCLAEKFWPAH